MGKKNKARKAKKAVNLEGGLPAFQWMAEDGVHMAVPGLRPSREQLKRMTEVYQKKIRNSPMWEMMVKEFGEQKAEEMLKEFQIKLS